jgi:hypothetical protein
LFSLHRRIVPRLMTEYALCWSRAPSLICLRHKSISFSELRIQFAIYRWSVNVLYWFRPGSIIVTMLVLRVSWLLISPSVPVELYCRDLVAGK